MIEPESIIRFVLDEQRERAEEQKLHSLLSLDALSLLGRAVTGLVVYEHQDANMSLECDVNESRIRPGSHVTLSCGNTKLYGEVIELEDYGRRIHVRLRSPQDEVEDGHWAMVESDRDFTPLIIQSLKKLQPGAPGWSLFQSLTDVGNALPKRNVRNETERIDTCERICCDARERVDDSQKSALFQCVKEPPILGIQGPPGTGKTALLSLVAEALSRLGRRVLVVAPTHQAVNNALAGIFHAFPSRKVIKVGHALRRESLPDDIECKLLKQTQSSSRRRRSEQQIIGMTFLSAMQHLAVQTSGLAPNVVLVDEAGQLPLSQGLCSGLFGAGSVLLFGDDLQMPPVFSSEMTASPFATSIFSQLRQTQPDSIGMLETTYRLNKDLCDFVADSFYADSPGKLMPSPASAKRVFSMETRSNGASEFSNKVLTSTQSICWIETPEVGAKQLNFEEAECVAALVKNAYQMGIPTHEMAVVTPFRRQAAAIRRLLKDAFEDHGEQMPVVDTVERVQGLTVEFVVISLCTTDSEYASDIAEFLFSANRLNVAVSRARTKVVILACPDLSSTVPSGFNGLVSLNRFTAALNRITARFKLERSVSTIRY